MFLVFIHFLAYIKIFFMMNSVCVFVCMYKLIYPFTSWWTCGCFQYEMIMNNECSLKQSLKCLCVDISFLFFWYFLGVEYLGHILSVFNFVIQISFSKMALLFCIHTINTGFIKWARKYPFFLFPVRDFIELALFLS